jgi:hypothetical protein
MIVPNATAMKASIKTAFKPCGGAVLCATINKGLSMGWRSVADRFCNDE